MFKLLILFNYFEHEEKGARVGMCSEGEERLAFALQALKGRYNEFNW